MKRNKWQGVACLLLSSLMVATPMAAPTNATTDKPAETKEATAKDQTKETTTTTKPAEAVNDTTKQATQTPSTAEKKVQPGDLTKPAAPPQGTTTQPQPGDLTKPATPPQGTTTKPQPGDLTKPAAPPQGTTTQPQPGDLTKPATPPQGTTTKPQPGDLTKPAAPPQGTTTKPQPGDLTKPAAPPQGTTKPNCKPCKPNDDKTQKPFTLDHFKMIVTTLKKLGVDEDEIVTYIKDGKKLEDILKAEKIKPKKFKKAMIKEYNKAVDEAEDKEQITSEQAKQLKAAIKDTVKNWLPNK